MTKTITNNKRLKNGYLPDMPLIIWMVFLTLILGFMGKMGASQLIGVFNTGFGSALGEFALILLPSFALAVALSKQNAAPTQGLATIMSPIAGAGMVCPDTAYAALSPIAGQNKLTVSFGAYAGFKLLYPAGPLIVATGLGVDDSSIALFGAALLIPVLAVGALWARIVRESPQNLSLKRKSGDFQKALRTFIPFGILAILLIIGALTDFATIPLLDFATQPKGALLVAAIWAMFGVDKSKRRECLDSAVGRTGSLLLVIGAASAFGAVLTTVLPVNKLFFIADSEILGIIGLFALSMFFKLAQGSSMATFAAVAPIAAPIVVGANLSSVAAVMAICLGSFIAILPNDSFYWLVRSDALKNLKDEGRAIYILAGGAILQAISGLLIVIAAMAGGII